MTQITEANQIDCSSLSSSDINLKIKNLIFNGFKQVILKNASCKENLLEGLKGNIKIEVIGDAFSNFANDIDGPRIILNGNIGNNSCLNIKNGKITVFGSCGNYFGSNSTNAEFYVFENCACNCFNNLASNSKLVIGGQCDVNFANKLNSSTIVVLNLKGGTTFIDETKGFLSGFKSGNVYLRGKIVLSSTCESMFNLVDVSDSDEDIYLPLISEFARLFNCSLSEIKSKPFHKIVGANLCV